VILAEALVLESLFLCAIYKYVYIRTEVMYMHLWKVLDVNFTEPQQFTPAVNLLVVIYDSNKHVKCAQAFPWSERLGDSSIRQRKSTELYW